MLKYCRDILSKQDRQKDLRIECMVQCISKHSFKIQQAIGQQHALLICRKYQISDRLMLLRVEEINSCLRQLDLVCKEIDASIDRIQERCNFNNHRCRPSFSHPKYRQWKALRRLIFERLEIECSLRQSFYFSDDLEALRVKLHNLRCEVYQLCLRVKKKIDNKALNSQLLAQVEGKLMERYASYEMACNLLNDRLRRCASKSVQLFSGIEKLKTSNRQIGSILSLTKKRP